ncbi:IMP dehydrogenase [Candidatus Woesearchaeota archaeon]|nr:IMP dehydrogenase [Candidatus Woesearchaeota archaeon]
MNEWNKTFFKKHKFDALTYDDVTFKTSFSQVLPHQTDISTRLSRNIRLKIPIVSADMDTVTEYRTAIRMAMEGGIGFLWKCPDISLQVDWVDRTKHAMNAKIEKPITINQNQNLGDVNKLIEKYGFTFSSLVVVNDSDNVVGLLTKDKTQFADNLESKVSDFMLKDPKTFQGELDLKGAYDFMKTNQIPKLILVDRSNKLTGMYTWKDVREIVEGITPMYNRDSKGRLIVGANVGVDDMDRVARLLDRECDVLLVGVAHGCHEHVPDTVRRILKEFPKDRYNYDIVAGNVCDSDEAKILCEAGADAIKVGVGPGSICTTRIQTGAGIPQITAIYKSHLGVLAAGKGDIPLIADGGIKYSGDLPKAFIAGASSVMIGSLLAGTEESPGERFTYQGQEYVRYRGMGSEGAMLDSKGSKERYGGRGDAKTSDKTVPEGMEAAVPFVGTLSKPISNLVGGLRQGMGYIGAKTIREMQDRTNFYRVTPAGQKESHPHDVMITKDAINYRR